MKMIAALFIIISLTGCDNTPYEKWQNRMANLCNAQSGKYYFDSNTKTISCYRAPTARHTYKIFTERYEGP